MPTYRHAFIAVLVTVALLAPSLTAQANWVSFNNDFDHTWERTDKPVADGQAIRTWVWGPRPFTDPRSEPYADSPGGTRLVQYFDKSRMEITNPSGDASSVWYVTNGLLATELITGSVQLGNELFEERSPANIPVGGDADNISGPTYATFAGLLNAPATPAGWLVTVRVDRAGTVHDDLNLASRNVTVTVADEVTGHSVALPFWTFMTSSGTVYESGSFTWAPLFENPYFTTGRPITEPYWASVKVAGTQQDVLIQCFERRCLTYTPDNAPEWQVEAGNVGQHYYTWRYNESMPAPPALPEPPPPTEADRDCSDFASQADAQSFFEANGGPAADPHDLDADGDGVACESTSVPPDPPAPPPTPDCDPSYPTLCIPPGAADLDCGDISARRFPVLPPDPHGFDGNDNDGIGCESG